MINNMDFSGSILNESRWARRAEIESAATEINLNDNSYPVAGLPVISDANTAFVDGKDTHTIIFGSTGSKKTRLFCMPMINMMIRAGESYIVTDPKGELHSRTSGMAKQNGYNIVVLDFRSIGQGDCWNPLEEPYKLYHNGNRELAMTFMNDFIASLSADGRERTNDVFWVEMAASLALANMTLLMECGKKDEVNLESFASMCSNHSINILKKIVPYIDENTIAGLNYRNVLSSAEKTLQSIQVSLYAWVRMFVTQKNLTKMLSKSTFETKSFGREKTGVYIIVPDEKTTTHFLVTTFIKQVYESLIDEAYHQPNGSLPVRVNFILDEFCNIPAIPDMPSMISAARSRNMRYFLIVQGMHQLKSKYGDDAETIKGNCENWVFLTSKELILLNEISNLCGTITTSDGTKRNLISVSELQRLKKEKGEVLLLYGRQYPFITELPDIDKYEMFKGYPGCEKKKASISGAKVINLNELFVDLMNGDRKLFEEECSEDDIKRKSENSLYSKFIDIFSDEN